MSKSSIIQVQGTDIHIVQVQDADFISLTDMVKAFEEGGGLIEKWLRNVNTLEFLGVWEMMYNPAFKLPEFGEVRRNAGLNTFTLSPKKWIETSAAIGMMSKSGRHGGGTLPKRSKAVEVQE